MRKHNCMDCGHPVASHSDEYSGWDLRGVPKDEWPKKKLDEGCNRCDCRRWFRVVKS